MSNARMIYLGAALALAAVVAYQASRERKPPGEASVSGFSSWLFGLAPPAEPPRDPPMHVNTIRKQKGLPPVDTARPWTREGNTDTRQAKPMTAPKPAEVTPNRPKPPTSKEDQDWTDWGWM
jgi:hypothetical protein